MKKVDIKTIDMQPFTKIGSEWMLITAMRDGKVNTMTASWGGLGVLWGKNVATVYIRPQRYTNEFVEASDTFTLSFFGGDCKKEMGYLGRVSGKDVPDKIEQAGLHVEFVDGQPTFAEATQVFVCKKLYTDKIKPENFNVKEVDEQCYPTRDHHFVYIAEIVEAYER